MPMPMSAHAASTVRMATPSENDSKKPKNDSKKPKNDSKKPNNDSKKPAAYVGVAPLESACQRRCHEGTI